MIGPGEKNHARVASMPVVWSESRRAMYACVPESGSAGTRASSAKPPVCAISVVTPTVALGLLRTIAQRSRSPDSKSSHCTANVGHPAAAGASIIGPSRPIGASKSGGEALQRLSKHVSPRGHSADVLHGVFATGVGW
jgi:hypothetical protein